MGKEELIQAEGKILEMRPNNLFLVELEQGGHQILAHLCGKMKKAKIRTLPGDSVTVEMSPYDLTKGRITFRHRADSEFTPPSANGKNKKGNRQGGKRR